MSAIFKKFKVWLEPFRYTYKDPDTGRTFEELSREALIKIIINYRINNKLEPIENIIAVLENYWCSLPENSGRCEVFTLKRNLTSVLKGGMFLIKDLIYGAEMRVSQGEANRRAQICCHCPNNIDATKTGTILAADEVISKYLGETTKTPYDKELGNCAVCSCVLRFKVHTRGPFDNTPIQAEEMRRVRVTLPKSASNPTNEQKCWQVDDLRV